MCFCFKFNMSFLSLTKIGLTIALIFLNNEYEFVDKAHAVLKYVINGDQENVWGDVCRTMILDALPMVGVVAVIYAVPKPYRSRSGACFAWLSIAMICLVMYDTVCFLMYSDTSTVIFPKFLRYDVVKFALIAPILVDGIDGWRRWRSNDRSNEHSSDQRRSSSNLFQNKSQPRAQQSLPVAAAATTKPSSPKVVYRSPFGNFKGLASNGKTICAIGDVTIVTSRRQPRDDDASEKNTMAERLRNLQKFVDQDRTDNAESSRRS